MTLCSVQPTIYYYAALFGAVMGLIQRVILQPAAGLNVD